MNANKHSLPTWMLRIAVFLFVAVATMALAARIKTQQWEVDVNATFDCLAEDLLIVEARKTVRLKLSAAKSINEDEATGKILCRFDLAGLKQGEHHLSVQAATLSLPKGVSLIETVTPTVTVRLEKKASQVIDVLPQLEGDPAPGFAVAAVRLKPDRVRLTATAELIDALETVRTHPINLNGASEPFRQQVPLNLPKAILVDPPSRIVVAEIDILPRTITRRLENFPLTAKGTKLSYRIDPETISLSVSGPEAVVNKIESDPAFSVTIDLEGLKPGAHRLKAAIKLPLDTTLVQAVPELFNVTINKQQ